METQNIVRNNTVDITRFVFAVIILFCHADLFIDINTDFYNIFFRLAVRVTVLYYLIVSGYYYISALLKGKANFKKQFFSVLKIYALWTLIYYVISFVLSVVIDNEPLDVFIVERIKFFFLDGSFYHFWYFLALLYSMAAITLVYRFFKEKGLLVFAIISLIFNIIAVFGTTYLFIGKTFPMLSRFYESPNFIAIMLIFAIGFSSFSSAYFIIKIRERNIFSQKSSLILLIITALMYLAECSILVLVFDSTERPYVFFTCYPLMIFTMLFVLEYPLPKQTKISELSKKSAGFIYYVHPLVLLGLQFSAGFIGYKFNSIFLAITALLITLAMTYVMLKIDNKFTNTLMGIGGKK